MPESNGLPIELDNLSIRRVEYRDASDLLEIYSNPNAAKYEFEGLWTADDIEDLLHSQADIYAGAPGVPLMLAVELQETNKVIGCCQITINSVQDRQGEIGFTFNPLYCGRGLATRAVDASLGYGFTSLQLHRIMAAVDVLNERSWQLMERIGMRREAHFVHDNLVDGEWVDDYVYAMLDNEWRAKNGTITMR